MALGRSAGDDREPGNLRWLGVELPADETGDTFPALHSRAAKQPVVRCDAGPVRRAAEELERACADERVLVRSGAREPGGLGEVLGSPTRKTAETSEAPKDEIRYAVRARQQVDASRAGVPREEGDIEPSGDGSPQALEHRQRVVLVVSHGEKSLHATQALRIAVRVDAGSVGHVVTLRFEPVGDRKLPEKPFAGSGRERSVDDLTILSIGAVEADVRVGTVRPELLAVVIE